MRSGLRPYATAGIAVAGASVIAVTPITAPPPDVEIRSVELSASTQSLQTPTGSRIDAVTWSASQSDAAPAGLSPAAAYRQFALVTSLREAIADALNAPPGAALTVASSADNSAQAAQTPGIGLALDPIAQWADIFKASFENIGWMGEQWLADPVPFLRQVVTNQIGYATEIADTMGTAIPAVLRSLLDPSLANGFAYNLVKAVDLIQANDITGASNAIYSGLLATMFGLFPMANLLQIPVQMAENLTNVLETAAGLPISVGFAAVRPVGHFFTAAGVSGQAITDALADQDPVAALEALISAPGNITGAVLNGDRFGGGLLSNNGVIATLALTVPRLLAAAITPEETLDPLSVVDTEKAPAAIESADGAKTPEPAKTVTLTVEPQAEPESASTTADAPAAENTEPAPDSDAATDLGDGNKATPGETGGTPKHRKPTKLSTTLKSISDDVDRTVSKVTDGFKKALGGNKSEPKQSAGSDGESGGDSAGSGESG